MTSDKQPETDKASSGSSSSRGGQGGFRPFADDSEALTISGLTIENGADRVSISGTLDLTKDQKGFEQAKALKAAIDALVEILAAKDDLPDQANLPETPTKRVRNPFG